MHPKLVYQLLRRTGSIVQHLNCFTWSVFVVCDDLNVSTKVKFSDNDQGL